MIIHAWAAGYISGMPLKSAGQLKTVSKCNNGWLLKPAEIIYVQNLQRKQSTELYLAGETWDPRRRK